MRLQCEIYLDGLRWEWFVFMRSIWLASRCIMQSCECENHRVQQTIILWGFIFVCKSVQTDEKQMKDRASDSGTELWHKANRQSAELISQEKWCDFHLKFLKYKTETGTNKRKLKLIYTNQMLILVQLVFKHFMIFEHKLLYNFMLTSSLIIKLGFVSSLCLSTLMFLRYHLSLHYI